jgi:hypothetical protein
MQVAWTADAHRRTFASMTTKAGHGLIGMLALVALTVNGLDSAHATSDKKPTVKLTEPVALKPASASQITAPQAVRIEEPVPQAKLPRPIAPQTPPPARTARPGSALPSGPVAIVTIPSSTPTAPKAAATPQPVKQVSAAQASSAKPVAQPGRKKPAPKKLVQTKRVR